MSLRRIGIICIVPVILAAPVLADTSVGMGFLGFSWSNINEPKETTSHASEELNAARLAWNTSQKRTSRDQAFELYLRAAELEIPSAQVEVQRRKYMRARDNQQRAILAEDWDARTALDLARRIERDDVYSAEENELLLLLRKLSDEGSDEARLTLIMTAYRRHLEFIDNFDPIANQTQDQARDLNDILKYGRLLADNGFTSAVVVLWKLGEIDESELEAAARDGDAWAIAELARLQFANGAYTKAQANILASIRAGYIPELVGLLREIEEKGQLERSLPEQISFNPHSRDLAHVNLAAEAGNIYALEALFKMTTNFDANESEVDYETAKMSFDLASRRGNYRIYALRDQQMERLGKLILSDIQNGLVESNSLIMGSAFLAMLHDQAKGIVEGYRVATQLKGWPIILDGSAMQERVVVAETKNGPFSIFNYRTEEEVAEFCGFEHVQLTADPDVLIVDTATRYNETALINLKGQFIARQPSMAVSNGRIQLWHYAGVQGDKLQDRVIYLDGNLNPIRPNNSTEIQNMVLDHFEASRDLNKSGDDGAAALKTEYTLDSLQETLEASFAAYVANDVDASRMAFQQVDVIMDYLQLEKCIAEEEMFGVIENGFKNVPEGFFEAIQP